MKVKEIMLKLHTKDYFIIAAVILTAFFYFFIAWICNDSLIAGLTLLRPVYVVLTPLLTIILVSRLRISLAYRLPLIPVKSGFLEPLTIGLLVLSVAMTSIAIYEIYALCCDIDVINDIMIQRPKKIYNDGENLKSLIFKGLYYDYISAHGAHTLGKSLQLLCLLAIMLNGLCWLVCVFFYRPQKIISAIPFFNTGLIMASFHCLWFLMNLDIISSWYNFEAMMNNLQTCIYYAILGFTCAIIFDLSRLYTLFSDEKRL